MSKKSNPTMIGAFVVGAAILLAVGIAIFGGSELLKERNIYIAYFVENTQGLKVGSNVLVNGVRVGHVSSVALLINNESFGFMTEVTIEILSDSYIVTANGIPLARGTEVHASMSQLIDEAGLRASLDVESFVTGQLVLILDLRPDTVAVLRGGPNVRFPEIPTIPSRSQELLSKVRTTIIRLGESFDIEAIGEHLKQALAGIDELANSQDLRESLAGINSIIARKDTQELTTTLRDTLDKLGSAATDASTLMQNADTKLDVLQPVIEELVVTLDEAQSALRAATIALRGESTEAYQLGTTLHEVEKAARALREFLDYLDRNPEALLRGKE
jgi:paraquat-inducible protein B